GCVIGAVCVARYVKPLSAADTGEAAVQIPQTGPLPFTRFSAVPTSNHGRGRTYSFALIDRRRQIIKGKLRIANACLSFCETFHLLIPETLQLDPLDLCFRPGAPHSARNFIF
ncbi:MAG: hypothetical protein EOP84_15765, partial [Verrucomicrobiaceae bacterium]